MKCDYIFIPTPDGLLLDAYYVSSRGKSGFIHLHGLTSRVRAIDKVEEMAKVIPREGFQLLLFNNRGFGNVNRMTTVDPKKKMIAGGSLERFEDCVHDIQGAVDYLKKRGCRRIYISGHSTGCQKAVYYMTKSPDRAVKGIVLQSPVNDTEGEIMSAGRDGFKDQFRRAKRFVNAGRRNEMIGRMSAGRFYDLHKKGSVEGRIFDFTRKRLAEVFRVKVPLLVLMGEKDQYIIPGTCPEKLELIKSSATSLCTCIMVKDADHGFKGKHRQVVRIIADWLATQ